MTDFGIILEKDPINSLLDSQTIHLPRLFSLTHSLDEITPILIKTYNGLINYLTEIDIKIIFTSTKTDLFLVYDNKSKKHCIYRIREATNDEKVSGLGDNTTMNLNATENTGIYNLLNSAKFSTINRTGIFNTTSNTTNSPYKMNTTDGSFK